MLILPPFFYLKILVDTNLHEILKKLNTLFASTTKSDDRYKVILIDDSERWLISTP
jgi:hypothetical protein